jgi:prolyl oligopeptidase
VLLGTSAVGERLFLRYLQDVKPRVIAYGLDGASQGEIHFDTIGTLSDVSGTWSSPTAFYRFSSFALPPTTYAYDVPTGKSSIFFRQSAPVNPDDFTVDQVWYASKDGTRVPMFIMYKKGLQRNGANPTLLTGYGGFNASQLPGFSATAVTWAENGGVYALANLRGGSEFGEAWHHAGMLQNKQNVFDDFAAAAESLVAQGWTSRDHLGISGGSNGGLLVGAAMTQRPELFNAVACAVPLLDMLRYQRFLIARFWIAEYGSAEDAEQYRWLRAYSPYHNTQAGTRYPAVLFTTAEGDSRVDPGHARKMTALVQWLQRGESDAVTLLRVDRDAGHGIGKPLDKQVEDYADQLAFFAWRLGLRTAERVGTVAAGR